MLIAGVVIAAVLVVAVSRMRPENGAKLGWMSEQWLAEYRASHYE